MKVCKPLFLDMLDGILFIGYNTIIFQFLSMNKKIIIRFGEKTTIFRIKGI